MPIQFTPYDLIVFTGLAVTGFAFWLMFGLGRKQTGHRSIGVTSADDRPVG